MRTRHPTVPTLPGLPIIGHLHRLEPGAPVGSLLAMVFLTHGPPTTASGTVED